MRDARSASPGFPPNSLNEFRISGAQARSFLAEDEVRRYHNLKIWYLSKPNKFEVHQLGGETPKLITKSSWEEYINNKQNKQDDFCEKDIILEQFKNTLEYKKFAESSLKDIRENKEMMRLLLE